ncbi:uncharacterized protein Z518_06314 [Rhinocladiella mackenziei CBS 650.93]|uniref:Rhinocladiella mackenziei CBS 650.93 unplaced genomic scaffold supercont1.4, whole genome shotgun sequence n=1 Tax=Rhinocladiella mackenziei CBS 650.93 TaxID=1442369 RepID=A0A0D2FTN0_9EURO|nr:uncharacterized protein Z518_06314 [Rhinocladiella mackenziei CBS 650.93]KIX05442.1 hypothetical protein Z518_06314 [Rhinocladiella mackenziei CBS 650.93]
MAPSRQQRVASKTGHSQIARKCANSAQKRPDSLDFPVELQQAILDVFRRAFSFDDQLDVKTVIQQVKGHLFLRDFASAFAKQEYLDAYALRWSASRALGYTDIFLHGDLHQAWLGKTTSSSSARREPHSTSASRIACIGGGGGAEVAACSAAAKAYALSRLEVHAIDIADWSTCLTKLENALCTPPQISSFASESAKAASKPLIASDQLSLHFSQRDIFTADEGEFGDMLGDVDLCTIMFTLNELFTHSISRTTAFLLALTDTMQPDSWLLVVDSPGSYSEVKLGQGDEAKTKQYPMKWLLDHTLLEVAGSENSKWKKHVSDDSRWFRLNASLKYPIGLENMRYQIHLYQRIGSEAS